MMWTTCLPTKTRFGAIESTTATGPSNVRSSPIADLLLELAAQRLDEALAAVDAAAGQQPVLAAAGLLVPAEEDAALPAEERGDADARLERHQAGGAAEAFLAALAVRELRHLDRLRRRDRHDDELGDPHAGLDDERLARGRC